jgi:hypothetical protein
LSIKAGVQPKARGQRGFQHRDPKASTLRMIRLLMMRSRE